MRAPLLFPDFTSALVIVCMLLVVVVVVVVMSGIGALSASGRRAAHSFAEAAATGRLDLAEREAARVLSRNDA